MTHMSDLSDMFTDETSMLWVIRRKVEAEVDMLAMLISSRQSDRVV